MKFIGWKDSILADMLESVQRLNNELNSRLKFESLLLALIDEYTEKIKVNEQLYNKLNNKCKQLEEDCENLKQNYQKLKEFAEKQVPNGFMLVRSSNGEVELYPR